MIFIEQAKRTTYVTVQQPVIGSLAGSATGTDTYPLHQATPRCLQLDYSLGGRGIDITAWYQDVMSTLFRLW